ncbi:DUF448 domain-containing protein [Geotalea sp. SG265]|uniref:DUF448 domain-containing protein n=1 Tax=Geotalea sp. SG265 TaxID=2922867 RepID=UPI001FAF84C8|nr:DUF448 domain-containing protein [Geotalea sp. SG265]
MAEKGPERTCIYCRTTRNKKELLRFVLAPDRTLVPDLLAKLPGRGAYTCMTSVCVKGAADKRQFSRAFKGEVKGADGAGLIDQLATRIEERIASYISLANKAGKVSSGTDMVLERMKDQSPGFLFIASDISADIGQKVKALAERNGVEYCTLFDKEKLGALIGKEMRVVVAIGVGGFIEPLKQETAKLRNFFEEGR